MRRFSLIYLISLIFLATACSTDDIKSILGESCSYTGECEKGLRCKNNRCVKPGVGDPCSTDDQCPTGFKCVNKKCGTGTPDGGVVKKDKGGLKLDNAVRKDGKSFNNEQGCQQWKAAMSAQKCGVTDMSTLLAGFDCGSFNLYKCDLSAYWQCLTDEFKCDAGIPNTSGWPMCGQKHTSCK